MISLRVRDTELLVPEGLFSVTFKDHKHIPGVRLSPDPIHQI